MKAMRRRIALQKHFVQNEFKTLFLFRRSLGSAHASSRRFGKQTCAELFSKFSRWFRLAFRELAVWQSPGTLLTKRQCEEFAKCQFVVLAIRGNANGDGVLRNIAAQRAMEFVPQTKDRAPV